MENIADRINSLIDVLGISKNEFAKKIGISSSLISQITTKKNSFRVDILQKITGAFPEINSEWLLNGIGEMWGLKHGRKPKLTEAELTVVSPVLQQIKDNLIGKGVAYKRLVAETQPVPYHYWRKVNGMIKNNNPDLYKLNQDIDLLLGFKDVIFTFEENYFSKIGNSFSRFPKGTFDLNEYEINITNSLKEIEHLKFAFDKMAAAIVDFYAEMKKQGITDIDFDVYSVK